jgi:5-formyltetrahydrofolate cyclo-ligase
MFYPLPDELDISILLQVALALGKELALPRFEPASGSYLSAAVRSLETDLKPGQFGTCEPAPGCQSVPLNRLDFALVPGVAFTLDGRRLGRGKGFYDRLLAGIRGLKCGVAFDQQLVDAIPTEPHDCRVDCILTPSLWHCVGPGAAME